MDLPDENTKLNYGPPEDEKERIQYFIEKVRGINAEKYRKTGKQPLMFSVAFGCQMNERDSEKIAGLLSEMGYGQASSEKDADFVIYNTCCVRENAENKIFGNLGRLKHYKELNPNLKIALCGCMLQQESIIDTIRLKYRYVDLLFGTFNVHRLPELLHTSLTAGGTVVDIWEGHGEIVEDLPSVRKYKWKAGVNIMYGCDNFCAYCIVPYVRGRERSRDPEEILKEIELFSNDGVKEVLLLGQNVNSYGKNLREQISFAQLLRKVSDIDGIERIRFMTSHPKDFSDELIYTAAELGKVCNHIHLPLQSGSTNILNKMNRKYTREQYLALVEKIKRAIPGVSITTDIIVGFPGETEEDFSDTLDVIRKVRFNGAFTFIYSKRSGTPASKMGQVEDKVISERFEHLLEVQNKIVFEENESYVGKTVKVLVDGQSAKNDEIISGRTEQNTIVHFNGSRDMLGQFTDVKITKNRAFFLEGENIRRI